MHFRSMTPVWRVLEVHWKETCPEPVYTQHKVSTSIKRKRIHLPFLVNVLWVSMALISVGDSYGAGKEGAVPGVYQASWGWCPYLSGCWETRAQGRWRACGKRSRAFADPSRWWKMRLQSDIVTIHPATDSMLLLSGGGRVILHLLTFPHSKHLSLQNISTTCQKRPWSSAPSAG